MNFFNFVSDGKVIALLLFHLFFIRGKKFSSYIWVTVLFSFVLCEHCSFRYWKILF